MQINFLNFHKSRKVFKKHGQNVKPDFYWRLIVFTVLVAALLSFIFGYYLFLQINKEPDLPDQSGSIGQMIKKERFDKVLEYFSTREKKSFEILNSPVLIVDPSL